MSSPIGATVRIVFYLISKTGNSGRWYTAKDVISEFNKLYAASMHFKKINVLLKHKKHSGHKMPLVFGSEPKMKSWLNKHTNLRTVFWFESKGHSFRFKKKFIHTLKKLI